MLHLLKTEIEYYKYYLGGIMLLPILFLLFAMLNIHLFQETYFLKKYFWSMLVGIGTYALVFILWTLRKRELRERIFASLPLTINQISIARGLFGVLPFLVVGIFIELLNKIVHDEQVIYIHRIFAQLGMMFIFLMAIDLVLNSWNVFARLEIFLRVGLILVLMVLILATSSSVIYAMSSSILKPFGFGGEEIYFYIWGLILALIDIIIFTKRKTFFD
ncbi:MAG: hypothetical protein KKF62_04575 [Bacteroidetes bacterium]|nr:hypothetical protein [Bacteroidota bacterium]MBU1114281.1 hypothetical protein [Bacteroidota bacterium]MBU1798018.1 hypothetical protein [Bacteroidota bacterium]